MNAKLFRPHQYFLNPLSLIISILLLSLFIPRHHALNNTHMYNKCKENTTRPCGKDIKGGLIEYPFWGTDIRPSYCGLEGFELSCEEQGDLVVDIGLDSKYRVAEVASRNFGQVSHKSDVYSYGMMILEMVGGRKNVNAGADHTSEIYYPRWLYKRIQFDDVLNLANEISAEENELVKKMVIVGLWCIQIYPSQRPSISKVIEMLEGQTAALEIPPQPYLCSVPSSPSNSQKKLVFSSSSGTEPTSSA